MSRRGRWSGVVVCIGSEKNNRSIDDEIKSDGVGEESDWGKEGDNDGKRCSKFFFVIGY